MGKTTFGISPLDLTNHPFSFHYHFYTEDILAVFHLSRVFFNPFYSVLFSYSYTLSDGSFPGGVGWVGATTLLIMPLFALFWYSAQPYIQIPSFSTAVFVSTVT